MARDLAVVVADKEDIISYEHNLVTKSVTVLIGVGSLDKEGNFIVQPNQTYKSYTINETAYDDLLAAKGSKPQEVFRKEDLWEPIDAKNSIDKMNLDVKAEK